MSLRLDKLDLRNFRCFGESSVAFHPQVTVLVGDNGRGKTAVLEALAIVLAQFVDALTECRQSDGIVQGDVRVACDQTAQTPTRLQVVVKADNRDLHWWRERKRFDKPDRQAPKAISEMLNATRDLRTRVLAAGPTDPDFRLPIVAYYPSNRLSENAYFGAKKRRRPCQLDGRLSGYRNYLNPLAESLHFNIWYRDRVLDVKENPVVGTSRPDSALRQLTAVRTAVDNVLQPTGWSSIDWDENRQCVVAEHPEQGRMPLASLSSGVRNMIAVVADLAHRCARLNPLLGGDVARDTPGIVLIDEVDLHLHPAWQQQVVECLRKAFPAIQFILTTHSPQVLSTVKSESIRVITLHDGNGQIETPRFQTRGVESADVLAEIMGVDPVPRVEEAGLLHQYRVYIENGTHDSPEGQSLREQLVLHFGSQHPLILECDKLIRFSAFKRRTAGGGTDRHPGEASGSRQGARGDREIKGT